jgi:predicted RNA-binding protein YlqC (UPF0109 family)
MSGQQGDVVGLVESIVISLADEADQVSIESSQSDDALIIEIRVAPEDVGKVIGRQGRIIKAIRTLSRAVSAYTDGPHIEVEVVDQQS